MATYLIGETIRLSAAFVNNAGTAIDPTAVSIEIKNRDLTTNTVYVYGVGAQIVKDAVGSYHCDYLAATAGMYDYSFIGSGASGASAQQSYFLIKARNSYVAPAP